MTTTSTRQRRNGRRSVQTIVWVIALVAMVLTLPGTSASIEGVTPQRLLDTRPGGVTADGLFGAGGPLAAGTDLELPVLGRAGIPPAGVGAVVVNITATEPTRGGYVTAYPTGVTRPTASNLNFVPGQTTPNLAIVPIGTDGRITLYNAAGDTHLIVDVQSWLPVSTPAPLGQRSYADRPDDVSGPQVHLAYVLPADGEDRSLDVTGAIDRSITLAQDWLATESGGQRLRLDTYGGQPDITFVRLTKTDAAIAAKGVFVREMVERGLHDAGHLRQDKIYLAYYDGTSTHSCGAASYPPALIGPVVAMYLRGLPASPSPCLANELGAPAAVAPQYLDIAMLHEFVHGLGLVAACAPNEHLGGHTSDPPRDLMYAGGSAWDVANMTLDVGRDDYYGHGQTGCPDLRHSAFLTPAVGPTWLPQGWGGTPASQAPEYG